MDDILVSSVFDHYDKTYLLDRYKGNLTGPVVRITETVRKGPRKGRYTLEVDAAVLKQILSFMESPIPPSPTSTTVRKRRFFRGDQCDAIKRNYLKGVASAALAVQYGCKAADIEAVLRAEGIVVVDPEEDKRRIPGRGYRKESFTRHQTIMERSTQDLVKLRHSNAYETWTSEADGRLRDLYQNGTTVERLMEIFSRQKGGITSRLKKLGL